MALHKPQLTITKNWKGIIPWWNRDKKLSHRFFICNYPSWIESDAKKVFIMQKVINDIRIRLEFQTDDDSFKQIRKKLFLPSIITLFLKNNHSAEEVPSDYYKLALKELKRNKAIMIIKTKKNDPRGDFVVVLETEEFEKYEKKVEQRVKEVSLGFTKPEDLGNVVKFDEKRSLLLIKHYQIEIKKRYGKPMAHIVLKYIFSHNYEGHYSEMIDEFENRPQFFKERPKYWRKIYRGCKDINEKITKSTDHKITDFLIFNTGIKGQVKINLKYLK